MSYIKKEFFDTNCGLPSVADYDLRRVLIGHHDSGTGQSGSVCERVVSNQRFLNHTSMQDRSGLKDITIHDTHDRVQSREKGVLFQVQREGGRDLLSDGDCFRRSNLGEVDWFLHCAFEGQSNMVAATHEHT